MTEALTHARLLLTDVDDVLLDWLGAFRSWVEREVGHVFQAEHPTQWDLAHWVGCDAREVGELIHRYNNESWEFGCIPPVAGAVEAVTDLRQAGWRIVAVTSCTSDPGSIRLRRANLAHVFGADAFEAVHVLPLAASKTEVLQRYRPAVWIDNNCDHALAGQRVGHEALVFQLPHNERFTAAYPTLEWIEGWTSIVGRLLNPRPGLASSTAVRP